MLLDRTEILRLIPHQGAMCLLDGVLAWDETTIVCCSQTHRDRANPLRGPDGLVAVHAVEYGAQATAVHGGLRAQAAGSKALKAYLAALRDISLSVDFLDSIHAPLQIRAVRLSGDRDHFMYCFALSAEGQLLAEGRLTLIIRPDQG